MTQKTISEAREMILHVWGDDPGVAIANAVLDHLETERPECIGIGDVARLGGREELDEDVTRALAMLVASPASVLTSRFKFKEEDGNLISTPGRKLFYDTPFLHPVTGDEVHDWQDRVYVDFTVNEGAYGTLPSP